MPRRTQPTPPRAPQTASTASRDEAPRYTWVQLDAFFAEPSAEDRAAYGVTPSADTQSRGADIASARILTDAQRWLGQLHDAHRTQPAAITRVFGYNPALARVFAAEVRTLRALNGDLSSRLATQQLRRANADAALEAAATKGRARHGEVHRALANAARVDPPMHAKVKSVTERPGVADLATSLDTLAALVEESVAPSSRIAARARARGLSPAVAADLRACALAVASALDAATGATPRGDVAQSDIDRQDGVVLTLMEELAGLFPTGRRSGLPGLQPLATRSYFSFTRRRVSSAPKPPPTPEPDPA